MLGEKTPEYHGAKEGTDTGRTEEISKLLHA